MSYSKIPKTTLWGCILGHGLELYDFTLYGAFSSLIALHFFSRSAYETAFFSALVALSVGYIARPLGAFLFGYIGDIYGRKKSLILTILSASLATGTLGMSPSYEAIGVWASAILFLARFTQGLCAGAETSDASILLIEHCETGYSSYGSAMIFLSGATGSLVALLISKIFMSLGFKEAWRIPFIIGFFLGGGVLLLRYKMKESGEFKKNVVKNTMLLNSGVFFTLIKHYPFGLLKAFCCGALSGITSTTIVVFISLFLYKMVQINIETALSFSFYGLSSFILACFMCSKIPSNDIRDKVLRYAVLGLLLFSLPYFYLVSTGTPSLIILAQLVLGILSGSFIAPVNSLLSEQFPAHIRCSGVSAGYNTGYALTSGVYPILSFELIKLTKNIYSPSIFMFSFASLLFFFIGKREKEHQFLPS